MSDRYQEFLDEMKSSGEVPDSWVERIQNTYEASGLRKENRDWMAKYQEAVENQTRLRETILETRFKEAGVPISPKALRVPDDLDPTESDKVNGWLTEMGLVEAKPTTDPEVRQAHDRIAAASNDGGGATLSLADLDPTKMTEDEFYAKVEAFEAANKR